MDISPWNGQRGTYRYFRVEDSGVQYLGPGFPTDPNGGSLVLLDTTAWISWGSGISESEIELEVATERMLGRSSSASTR